MALKDLMTEISNDVSDVYNTNFEYTATTSVPNRGDNQLSFERGVAKKGKLLKTCVLYVDIRNSVELTVKHQNLTMGKIYTAFAKAVLKVAKNHNGHIRNIIGDRIMIVFPSANCYNDSVDCAISINHIAQNIINSRFSAVDFKCGIGIDYGEMRIIKVGIPRRGTEGTENRSLIWTGYPANFASRLTDVANKIYDEVFYEVKYKPANFSGLGLLNFGDFLSKKRSPMFANPPENLPERTITQTPEEFAKSIFDNGNGTMGIFGGQLISFTRKTKHVSFPPILMTERVYKEFKRLNSTRNSILKNLWHPQAEPIKNVTSQIYGGDITWTL